MTPTVTENLNQAALLIWTGSLGKTTIIACCCALACACTWTPEQTGPIFANGVPFVMAASLLLRRWRDAWPPLEAIRYLSLILATGCLMLQAGGSSSPSPSSSAASASSVSEAALVNVNHQCPPDESTNPRPHRQEDLRAVILALVDTWIVAVIQASRCFESSSGGDSNLRDARFLPRTCLRGLVFMVLATAQYNWLYLLLDGGTLPTLNPMTALVVSGGSGNITFLFLHCFCFAAMMLTAVLTTAKFLAQLTAKIPLCVLFVWLLWRVLSPAYPIAGPLAATLYLGFSISAFSKTNGRLQSLAVAARSGRTTTTTITTDPSDNNDTYGLAAVFIIAVASQAVLMTFILSAGAILTATFSSLIQFRMSLGSWFSDSSRK